MTEMFLIYCVGTNESKQNSGYLSDDSILVDDEDKFSFMITPKLSIEHGTVALFSQNRAASIAKTITPLTKKFKPDWIVTVEVQSKMIPETDMRKILNKGYTFKSEASENSQD